MRMQALVNWPLSERAGIVGILTDIDDTLTTHGRLTADVMHALQRAKHAGLKIIAVTGRPTYWALPLLRLCDFDAIIAENGASAFWLDQEGRQQSLFYADSCTRQQHRQQLEVLVKLMQQQFPHVPLADDAPMRVGDLAFDIGEYASAISDVELAEVLALMHAQGMCTSTSSIHAHASLVPFSKQLMSQRVLQEVFQIDDVRACRQWVFVGDSANDASMFAHYPHTVGVANVRRFLHRFDSHPVYVTAQEYGAGIVELVDSLLANINK
ncbi:HAD-IIB family hydrolase [soil metagenome]